MRPDGRPLPADGRGLEAEANDPAIQQGTLADARAGFIQGMRLLQEGRFDAAVDVLSRAVGLDAQDPECLFALGAALIATGRADEAYACYERGLALRPDNAPAQNDMGNLLASRGRMDEAIGYYRRALALDPGIPEAYNNLGILLKQKGELDDAIRHYTEALRLRPDYAEASYNLGLAHTARGQLDAALARFQQAARLRPDYFEAHHQWGNALADRDRLAEAVESYREAVRLRPDNPVVRKSLGAALAKMEQLDEAIAELREAIRLRPAYAEAHNDLGIAYSQLNRFEEAAAAYRAAVQHRPRYPEAHNNLGNTLRNLGRLDESFVCYRKAIELNPESADAYNNLGLTYADQGRLDDAVANYTKCLELCHDHVDAHINRALTWLRKGDYARGWPEYEWRWKKRPMTDRTLIMPQWDGSPLTGRRIVFFTEQGLGDTIQFARFCQVLKRQGAGAVMLECPERLVKILSRTPGIDHLVLPGEPLPDYDVYCPLMNVPGLIATSVESIPAEVPYVFADPDLVEHWRRELAGVAEIKVGISWQGNPRHRDDRRRSIPLATFEPLARIPGVRLFSIQQIHGLDQLQALDGKFPVTDLGPRLNQTTGPFMDTAAVLMNLDLTITCDSAPAHLAGALGAPVWMAIANAPDWRWLTHREDSPWYPSMRIFRQHEGMLWSPVFERIAAELRAMVRARARNSEKEA